MIEGWTRNGRSGKKFYKQEIQKSKMCPSDIILKLKNIVKFNQNKLLKLKYPKYDEQSKSRDTEKQVHDYKPYHAANISRDLRDYQRYWEQDTSPSHWQALNINSKTII